MKHLDCVMKNIGISAVIICFVVEDDRQNCNHIFCYGKHTKIRTTMVLLQNSMKSTLSIALLRKT